VDVGTTPEGYKFVYRRFVTRGGADYKYINASTYDNEANLPDGYIQSLLDTYPEYLIKAYLNGQFTNLTSGTVYRQFSRSVHNSTETIREGEPLFIGQDFNVGNMASVICVNRAGKYHVAAELTGVMDTLHLCDVLRERYPKSEITIFPDATGAARNTADATKTDIRILRSVGFTVITSASNPPIKDRVLVVNTALEKGNLFVNVKACPNLQNVDGAGASIYQQSQAALKSTVAKGRAGLLVEYPIVHGEATRHDMETRKYYATIQRFEPDQIINWSLMRLGANMALERVVLRDTLETADGII
jgi:hypothetical protein